MRMVWTRILLIGFGVWSVGLSACDDLDIAEYIKTKSYQYALNVMNTTCLADDEKDKSFPLVSEYGKAMLGDGETNATDVLEALRVIENFAIKRGEKSPVHAEDWKALTKALVNARVAIEAIPAQASLKETQDLAAKALPKGWERIDQQSDGEVQFDARSVKLLGAIASAGDQCAKEPAFPCDQFDSRRDMIRVVKLAARVRAATQDPGLRLHQEDAKVQGLRWDAYRSQGQHQYFWEVLVNSLKMGNDDCPIDPVTKIQKGFCRVPTSQFIVLHPDAGLRWVRIANQSSELRPAFLVEMLGYFRWDWESATSARMTNRYGASVVAAYTDVDTAKKWSFGPMFHFGTGYNLAVTKASGEKWSLLINLNLAERYFERKKAYVQYLQNKKATLGSLLD